jgi:hypothetical protein
MSRYTCFMWVVAFSLLVSRPVHAITQKVPGDQWTIDDALHVAGITQILVAPGHIEASGTIQLPTGLSLEVVECPRLEDHSL